MRQIPEHLVELTRELAGLHRAELHHQMCVRKGIFGDAHPDTIELRRQLTLADELCAAVASINTCAAA